MQVLQSFTLQTQRDGKLIPIPRIPNEWVTVVAQLKAQGFEVFKGGTATNGIPHNVLVGGAGANWKCLQCYLSPKQAFCALVEPLGLPFVPGEFFTREP